MSRPFLISRSLTLFFFLTQSLLPAYAGGMVPDTNAPQDKTPTVTNAANGVPVVQIAPTNAAGVSHNLYQEVNVGTPGAVLNNATEETLSCLAGSIPGNPYLNKPASLILNEVTSLRCQRFLIINKRERCSRTESSYLRPL